MRYYINNELKLKELDLDERAPCHECIVNLKVAHSYTVLHEKYFRAHSFTDCTRHFLRWVYENFGENTFTKIFSFFNKNEIHSLWCDNRHSICWTKERLQTLLNMLGNNKLEIE